MLEPGPRAKALKARLQAFMDAHVYPNEELYDRQLHEGPEQFRQPPIIEELKEKARAEGLWNLFLPHSKNGAGLTNLEYAALAEIMGRVHYASEVFNCSAPDTGNMEVLDRYGSDAQKERWLKPLLAGEIRSAYCMTEPDVASSDATNIETRIERDGDDYVINGRKWWITNACHPLNRLFIVMGKTDPAAPRHLQQSQILVPADAPGITRVRPLSVLGFHDEPKGHAELVFENVRVPKENLILGEGRGLDFAGAARPRAHPSLHAHHRPVRAVARADLPPPALPRRFRQAARQPVHLAGTDRGCAYPDQYGAPPDTARRASHGYRRQQGSAQRNRANQGRRHPYRPHGGGDRGAGPWRCRPL